MKSIPEPFIRFDQEGEEEFESIDNMLVGDTIGLPAKKRVATKPNKNT